MNTTARTVTAALAFALLSAAAAPAAETRAPAPTERARVKVEVVATALEHPWALQFLPDGRMLVTERPGRLRVVGRDGKPGPAVTGLPPIAVGGQGGLLDIALAPDFATTGTIHFTYAEPRGGGSNGTTLARARLTVSDAGGALTEVRVVFQQQPAAGGGLHFGSRIVHGRDGTLFVALGERFQRDRSQDLGTHYGKVVRLLPDGAIPPDNPFLGRANVLPAIFSLGHRNPQGAALHPVTGKLWVVEHGARGGDEINVVQAGRNYGWPVITYGRDYSGATIGEGTAKAGLEQPVYYWDPSIAPAGLAFYTADLIPAWKGNLFIGALAGQHLTRLVLDGEKVVAEEKLLADLGERIRDVRQGPDGALYVATDHPQGRILRVTAP